MNYKIGQTVWIKPIDAGDLKGKIVGFQKVEPFYPIIEFEYAGEKTKSSFSPSRISPYRKGKVKSVYLKLI